jgi:serine/threonine protein kinase
MQVQYLHSIKIVHRDLKPENIMITDPESLQVKIVDMGLSRTIDDSDSQRLSYNFGTAEYVAAEICTQYAVYDHRVDSYSVALIVFAMLVLRSCRGPQPRFTLIC